ncbi:MAG: helix-turn-helix domain-containing protein [Lysobacterales bacterium]
MKGGNRRELCRRFGISPKTGYKWLHRYQSEGPGGLQERSRCPHHCPQCTDVVIAQRTIALRRDHPDWGGRKLRRRLLDLGHRDVPAPSTITDILRVMACWTRRHGGTGTRLSVFRASVPQWLVANGLQKALCPESRALPSADGAR